MAEITKPTDLSQVWCSAGDLIKPSTTKISTGWEIEVPPRQWFNWLDNRQDQALAHINQHGVPVWDSVTEYQAGKSLAMGSDGIVYRAISTSINQNPVTDTSHVYWSEAFATTNGQVIGVNGCTPLGNGLLMQWGETTGADSNGLENITFTVPFTTAVFSFTATHFGQTATGIAEVVAQRTLTGTQINILGVDGSIVVGRKASWVAIGK